MLTKLYILDLKSAQTWVDSLMESIAKLVKEKLMFHQ
jgi:hypothetical protein